MRLRPGARRYVVVPALAAVLAVVLTFPATAACGPASRAGGERWLDATDLYPGGRAGNEVVLGNDTDLPVVLHLRVADLVEDENGCIGPETHDPDEQCEADGGELAEWLTLGIETDAVSWSGALTGLEDYVPLPLTIPARGSLPVEVSVSMDIDAGNATMTDKVGFDVHLAGEQELRPPDVLGEDEVAPPAGAAGTGLSDPVVLGVGAYNGPTSVDAGLGALLDGEVRLPLLPGRAEVSTLLELSVAALLLLALAAAARERRRRGLTAGS